MPESEPQARAWVPESGDIGKLEEILQRIPGLVQQGKVGHEVRSLSPTPCISLATAANIRVWLPMFLLRACCPVAPASCPVAPTHPCRHQVGRTLHKAVVKAIQRSGFSSAERSVDAVEEGWGTATAVGAVNSPGWGIALPDAAAPDVAAANSQVWPPWHAPPALSDAPSPVKLSGRPGRCGVRLHPLQRGARVCAACAHHFIPVGASGRTGGRACTGLLGPCQRAAECRQRRLQLSGAWPPSPVAGATKWRPRAREGRAGPRGGERASSRRTPRAGGAGATSRLGKIAPRRHRLEPRTARGAKSRGDGCDGGVAAGVAQGREGGGGG